MIRPEVVHVAGTMISEALGLFGAGPEYLLERGRESFVDAYSDRAETWPSAIGEPPTREELGVIFDIITKKARH